METVSPIIELIVAYMKQALVGIVQALVAGADELIYQTVGDTKELTTLFAVVLTFTALSIGFTIVKWLFNLVKVN